MKEARGVVTDLPHDGIVIIGARLEIGDVADGRQRHEVWHAGEIRQGKATGSGRTGAGVAPDRC